MTKSEQKYLYEFIGSQIKSLRSRSGMSQKDLAEKLELSRASVVNIEKGRQHPSVHLLIDIARIFNVSLNVFLDRSILDFDKNKGLNKLKNQIKASSKSVSDQEKIFDFIKKVTND